MRAGIASLLIRVFMAVLYIKNRACQLIFFISQCSIFFPVFGMNFSMTIRAYANTLQYFCVDNMPFIFSDQMGNFCKLGRSVFVVPFQNFRII